QRIKWLKENSDSDDIKAWDVPELQEQLNQLQQDDAPPPPPPPPPPSSLEMTVESDKEFAPLRWHKDSDSVYVLLREIAYACMRRDTAFFERVLDDDFVGVGPDGVARNKAEEIAEVNRSDFTIKKFEFEDLRVSGNDEVSFATFVAKVHYQANGQDSIAQYRYTVNFIKQDVLLDGDKLRIKIIPDKGQLKDSGEMELAYRLAVSRGVPGGVPGGVVGGVPVKIEKGKKLVEGLDARDFTIYSDEKKPVDGADKYFVDIHVFDRQLKIAAIHISRKQ